MGGVDASATACQTGRSPDGGPGDAIRVMIVDDSAVVRGFIGRALETDERIVLTASVANGQIAVDRLPREPVDVIILDVEMPVLNGLDALPKLLHVDPAVRVIIASTLSTRGADITLRCLDLGAVDYVPKPTTAGVLGSTACRDSFIHELIGKVLAHGLSRRHGRPLPGAAAFPVSAGAKSATRPLPKPAAARPRIVLRRPGRCAPRLLAIGCSTGGPQALGHFVPQLAAGLTVPVLITQHMPPTFTAILARNLAVRSGLECSEAADGVVLRPRCLYVAPGDFHLIVDRHGGEVVLRLEQSPPRNFCRPSVDPMFESAARVFGGHVLGVVLTGMGSDGLAGSRAIVEAGGTIIAQDEPTSVVWGMPGAVACAGLCAAVLPLSELHRKIPSLIAGPTR